jgi:hypothetical protein
VSSWIQDVDWQSVVVTCPKLCVQQRAQRQTKKRMQSMDLHKAARRSCTQQGPGIGWIHKQFIHKCSSVELDSGCRLAKRVSSLARQGDIPQQTARTSRQPRHDISKQHQIQLAGWLASEAKFHVSVQRQLQ